jgi:hypothetical protein
MKALSPTALEDSEFPTRRAVLTLLKWFFLPVQDSLFLTDRIEKQV